MEHEDALTEDLETFFGVISTATEELVDSALGSNIERRHHLESAVDAFHDIETLLKAEKIVRELFGIDQPSATQNTSSRTTHDDTHDDGHRVPDAV